MTNYNKLRLLVDHLQFLLDEELITEDNCGTVKEEIFSTMEILADCDADCAEAYATDMAELKN